METRIMRHAMGLSAVLLLAAACSASPPRLTFDGTSCSYDGPTAFSPGDVEITFDNMSDQYAAAAFLTMPSDEEVRASEVALVGKDFPITGDPAGGSELIGTILADPGESVMQKAPLPVGAFLVDCAMFSGDIPSHGWRAAVLDVTQ